MTTTNQAQNTIKTIGAALSFSPSYYPVLEQAKLLADALGASLILMHVGDKTEEKELALNNKMKELNMDYDSTHMIWKQGKKTETILSLCELNNIDLLVLGAQVKENIFKYYLGSVARTISRKADCSVMLVTSLISTAHKYNKIVVNGIESEKNENTLATALHIAEQLKVEQVYIVNEIENQYPLLGDSAIKNSELERTVAKRQEEQVERIAEKYENSSFLIKNRVIKGKPGYAVSTFAKNKKADLLVVSSPDINLNVMDRIFTHDMEYILAHLPCNLLIVDSKKQE